MTTPDEPVCPYCLGTGEIFTHAEDCRHDTCALNGDIDSCDGSIQACSCGAGNVARASDPTGGGRTATAGVCRVCGCTDEWGCDGGCYRVDPDLRSACVDEAEDAA